MAGGGPAHGLAADRQAAARPAPGSRLQVPWPQGPLPASLQTRVKPVTDAGLFLTNARALPDLVWSCHMCKIQRSKRRDSVPPPFLCPPP